MFLVDVKINKSLSVASNLFSLRMISFDLIVSTLKPSGMLVSFLKTDPERD
jgi:hypothetical protein